METEAETPQERVNEVLKRIQIVRASMNSASGWSWREAGYNYDPDDGMHQELKQLERQLDELLKAIKAIEAKPETLEQYLERVRFIRGAAVMLWCTESYNEPKRCWGDAQMLWGHKPEDC